MCNYVAIVLTISLDELAQEFLTVNNIDDIPESDVLLYLDIYKFMMKFTLISNKLRRCDKQSLRFRSERDRCLNTKHET